MDEALPLLGHGEDRWNGVHGKNQIGGFHHQQHERQRRQRKFAIQPDRELLPVELGRDGKELPGQPDRGPLPDTGGLGLGLGFFFVGRLLERRA